MTVHSGVPDEALEFFCAAVRAVAGVQMGAETLEFRSGRDVWDRVVRTNPAGTALANSLTDEQSEIVCNVLTGMLRERSGGSVPARLTVPACSGIAIGERTPG